MYLSVPLSLIAIHFVGSPESGAFVSVPPPLPRLPVSALFVVSKYDPPTTVIPPFAVRRPVIVVVEVTARVEPQLTVPLKVLLPVNVCARPSTATVSVAVIIGRLSCRLAVTAPGTMVVAKAVLAACSAMVPAVVETTPSVRVLVPEIVVKAPVLAVVPPMAPGVVSAVAMSAVAMARYAGAPAVAVANNACVAVALVAATATVPVTFGKVAVLPLLAVVPTSVMRFAAMPRPMLPLPVVSMSPPPLCVSILPPMADVPPDVLIQPPTKSSVLVSINPPAPATGSLPLVLI